MVRRSNSVYRSFSALAALIQLSRSEAEESNVTYFVYVYPAFAANGLIFHLETLARSLRDTCVEKEYLLALVDLGRAAFIATTKAKQRYDDKGMRTGLVNAIHLQQYVPSPQAQSYLILFLQSAQRYLHCFRWKCVRCLRKSIRFPLVFASLSFLSHR